MTDATKEPLRVWVVRNAEGEVLLVSPERVLLRTHVEVEL